MKVRLHRKFTLTLGVNESKMSLRSQNPKSFQGFRSQRISGYRISRISNFKEPCLTEEKDQQDYSNPVKEYAEASTIHGIRYIAEDGRHHFER